MSTDAVGHEIATGRRLDAVGATTTAAAGGSGTVTGLDAVETTRAVAAGGSGTVCDHLLLVHLPCRGPTHVELIRRREMVTKGPSRNLADLDQPTVAGGLVALLQSPEWHVVLEKGPAGG